jgi:hypothetical protein
MPVEGTAEGGSRMQVGKRLGSHHMQWDGEMEAGLEDMEKEAKEEAGAERVELAVEAAEKMATGEMAASGGRERGREGGHG